MTASAEKSGVINGYLPGKDRAWHDMLLVGGEFLFAQVQEFFRGQKGLCQFCANLNDQ